MTANESTVSFASLEISLAAAGRNIWGLDVVARLHGGESSDELFIISQNTPLVLDEVLVRPPLAATMITETNGPSVRVTRRPRTNSDWSEGEVTLRLRWCRPSAAQSLAGCRHGALETPCLVLPNMLPRLVDAAGAVTLRPPSRLPRIFFRDELPPELNAGGVAVPDRS